MSRTERNARAAVYLILAVILYMLVHPETLWEVFK